VAVEKFGLTANGRQQVTRSVGEWRSQLAGAIIYSSDFRRARETAEIAGQELGVGVALTAEIRERWFGEWDGTTDANYQRVWNTDETNARHQQHGVESVVSVADRMGKFVRQLDRGAVDQTFLLVSHGDPLQILITATSGAEPRLHRQLDPLKTAEIRPLTTAPTPKAR